VTRSPTAIAIAVVIAGCGATIVPPAPLVASHADRDVAIVLYRDGALVRDRRWVTIDRARGTAGVDVAIPDDVAADDVIVAASYGGAAAAAHGGAIVATGTDARAQLGALDVGGVVRSSSGMWVIDDGHQLHLVDPPQISAAGATPGAHVRAAVEAPSAGRYPIDVVYVTQAMSWRATYTLIGGRPGGRLHGSLIIDNKAGVALGAARVSLIDDSLGEGAGAVAQAIAGAGGELASTSIAEPIDVGVGEIAVDLVGGEKAVSVRSILVYDPIGAALDASGHVPIQGESYGMGKASPGVDESEEIELGAGSAALPAGTVRLVERARDGALRLRGQGQLRGTAGAVTTVAIGRSPDVRGRRERSAFSLDLERKRLVEEFAITIDNGGDHAVDVLVREHLYRGLTWTIAYYSTAIATQEGHQQIALRTSVPAHGQAKVVYVVVYPWGKP